MQKFAQGLPTLPQPGIGRGPRGLLLPEVNELAGKPVGIGGVIGWRCHCSQSTAFRPIKELQTAFRFRCTGEYVLRNAA